VEQRGFPLSGAGLTGPAQQGNVCVVPWRAGKGKSRIMKRIANMLGRLAKDERGTETLEWGLVCGLIVIGAITMIVLIGPKVTDMWNDVNNEIPAAD
jgi:Flp pilus assembly pilin Flp